MVILRFNALHWHNVLKPLKDACLNKYFAHDIVLDIMMKMRFLLPLYDLSLNKNCCFPDLDSPSQALGTTVSEMFLISIDNTAHQMTFSSKHGNNSSVLQAGQCALKTALMHQEDTSKYGSN